MFQRKYNRVSKKYLDITRKMAIFVGSCSVPNSIVENDEFRSLVEALDSRYHVPGRTKITKEIDQVLLDMKSTILEIFSHAHKLVYVKRGMTSSYLGITGHFLCRHGYKKHIVMLAVRVLAHPHMAEHIKFTLDELLSE